jgi:phage-related protein (TIGR01555 family)
VWNLWKRKSAASPEPEKKERPRQVFSTDDMRSSQMALLEQAWAGNFKDALKPIEAARPGFAMDNQLSVKSQYGGSWVVPTAQSLWYSSQSFIGYQFAALMAQNWLVSKACLMPAKDATRNGYEITVDDGTEVDPKIMDEIRKLDLKYKVNKNLIEFVQMGRVFGIRVAMFIIETDNPADYYKKPFNPDGIKPGSYKGISQIDPYWITPQLDDKAAGDPASINFYEPTWWMINGLLVHRSHLVIFKTEEVADILKPTYIYGGIPIPQKIYERVYAAERTANEAPMLVLTKRMDIYKTDLAQGLANEPEFAQQMARWVANRDNYGIKFIDREDDMIEFDTSLTDLDAVIMTQYQLVAAAANVPATKLLGTTPKGFNSTGEYEESNYHEELESIQYHDLSPLLERHHLLLIRSEIAPKYKIAPFETSIEWNSLDAMTAKEQAELNKMKAETGAILMQSGAIDGMDERNRIINDPVSGYTGIDDEMPEKELSDPEGA